MVAAAMSSDGTLHWEILTDVLSRLPVKSLCRFKSVSPSWNSLISDTYFAKTHLNRTKTLKNPKHLYQNEIIMSYHKVHNLYSVDFAGVNPTITKLDFPTMAQHDAAAVTVRGSCDGLLLASLHVLSNLFLLNPSTKECNKLPFPPSRGPVLWMRGSLHGLGYDSSTDDYKVVLIIYCYRTVWDRSDDCDVTVVNVYSLRTNAWRRIKNTDYYRLKENSGGVFFKGCIHGLCWRDGSKVMVAFDLSDEIFREVPLPASFSWCGISRYDVVVLGGCLCLVDGRQTEVWMMKEYGIRESWTEFTIRSGFRTANLLCLLAEDGFFLRTTGEKLKHLVEYNQKKDTARDKVVCGVPPRFSFEGIYVESLISPHHRRGIERQ